MADQETPEVNPVNPDPEMVWNEPTPTQEGAALPPEKDFDEVAAESEELEEELEEEENILPPLTPEDIQALVNEIVWKHGTRPDKKPNWSEVLTAAGLTVDQVNPAMLKHAERVTKKRSKELAGQQWTEEENQQLKWMPQPDVEVWASGQKVFSWETKCGRYRVYRLSDPNTGAEFAAQYRTPEGNWDIFESSNMGPGYPKKVTSLDTALLAIEKFHEKEFKTALLQVNRHEVLEEEEKLFPKAQPPMQSTGTPSTGRTPSVAQTAPPSGGRVSKNSDMDQRILAVLDVTNSKSPKQIKIDANIPLTTGINSIMKRLGKDGKVVVGYGAYKLDPAYAATLKPPTPTPPPPHEEPAHDKSHEHEVARMESEGAPPIPEEK